MNSDDGLLIKRHFQATKEKVFTAFTDSGRFSAWLGSDRMSIQLCEMDLKIGGKW